MKKRRNITAHYTIMSSFKIEHSLLKSFYLEHTECVSLLCRPL